MDEQKAIYKDEQTQQMLNEPLANSEGNSAENEKFLSLLLSLIEEGKIELYRPSSLINTPVYEGLDDENKSKADLESVNMLAKIRDIKGLCDAGYRETFQVENLVHTLRESKERLEEAGGDLFII